MLNYYQKSSSFLKSDVPTIIYQSSSKETSSITGQCNACSSVISIKNNGFEANDEFEYICCSEQIKQPLNSTDCFAVLSPTPPFFTVLNKSAINCLQYFSTSHYIKDIPYSWEKKWGKSTVKSILNEMVNKGIIVPENHVKPELSETETILTAWLHTTNRCNLRCSYCYIPHNRTDMSLETGKESIENVFDSAIAHGYKTIQLKYSGGEPLIQFPLIFELQKYAQILAGKYDLKIDGVILSNGTLLTSIIIEKIKSLNLRLMISLDGLETYHNCHRFFSDGSDSFEKVLNSIELALSQDLIPDISITVSNKNIKGLPELMEWILKYDLPFNINYYRENDYSKHHTDLKLKEEYFINGMLDAYKVIESNLPRSSLLSSLIDRGNLTIPHLMPCGVGHSYMVFNCEGKIFKCHMQMDKSMKKISTEDSLTSIRNDMEGIQNIKVDDKEDCKLCQWKYWCAGGCPLENCKITGRYDVKSKNCNIYKTLFPEVIRLEGMRLIKYVDEIGYNTD